MDHVIQNADVNAGPASYKHLAADQLLISSIFYTIQGEGPFAGMPSVFIRLAGCNRGRKEDMGCRFCDTDFRLANGQAMTYADIETKMIDVSADQKSGLFNKLIVVITGGEPMMQKNLVGFLHYLRSAHWGQIQIESNGDKLLADFPRKPWLTLVVSPKAVGNDYHEPNDEVFDRVDCYKFVVEAVAGSPYFMPPGYAHTCGRQVFVSPLTTYLRPVNPGEIPNAWNYRLIDTKQTQANYRHAAALALRYGFRLSMQQHLFFGLP